MAIEAGNDAPDFAKQLDESAFRIPQKNSLKERARGINERVGSIGNDWSRVNELLAALGGEPRRGAAARATGNNLVDTKAAQLSQEDLGTHQGDAASIGKALMRLGSKGAINQLAGVAGTQAQEQTQAAREATGITMAQAQLKLNQQAADLQLNNEKFQLQRATGQVRSGLDLAQLQMTNMFNSLTAQAKNAQDIGDIELQRDSFANTMMYINAALQATSLGAAAGAGYYQDKSRSNRQAFNKQATERGQSISDLGYQLPAPRLSVGQNAARGTANAAEGFYTRHPR